MQFGRSNSEGPRISGRQSKEDWMIILYKDFHGNFIVKAKVDGGTTSRSIK